MLHVSLFVVAAAHPRCPAGASCAGGGAEPVALPGYYIGYADYVRHVNGTTVLGRNDGCSPRHNRSEGCLMPLPCDPPESCLGGDVCAENYISSPPLYRCAACSKVRGDGG